VYHTYTRRKQSYIEFQEIINEHTINEILIQGMWFFIFTLLYQQMYIFIHIKSITLCLSEPPCMAFRFCLQHILQIPLRLALSCSYFFNIVHSRRHFMVWPVSTLVAL